MSDEVEVIDSNPSGTDLVQTSENLFGTDPVQAYAQMERVVEHVATKLSDKKFGNKFIVAIGKTKYPTVNWWVTVGSALGLRINIVWVRDMKREGEIAWEARTEILSHTGAVVSSAESMCSSLEENWGDSPENAIRSMAQTRATAKAYRMGLSPLAAMAKLSGTPAEEMEAAGKEVKPSKARERAKGKPKVNLKPVAKKEKEEAVDVQSTPVLNGKIKKDQITQLLWWKKWLKIDAAKWAAGLVKVVGEKDAMKFSAKDAEDVIDFFCKISTTELMMEYEMEFGKRPPKAKGSSG